MEIVYDKTKKTVYVTDSESTLIEIMSDGTVCFDVEHDGGKFSELVLSASELRRLADAAEWFKYVQYERYGEQVMPKIDGITFRCEECNGNVFTIVAENIYSCNGCQAEYLGEP